MSLRYRLTCDLIDYKSQTTWTQKLVYNSTTCSKSPGFTCVLKTGDNQINNYLFYLVEEMRKLGLVGLVNGGNEYVVLDWSF